MYNTSIYVYMHLLCYVVRVWLLACVCSSAGEWCAGCHVQQRICFFHLGVSGHQLSPGMCVCVCVCVCACMCVCMCVLYVCILHILLQLLSLDLSSNRLQHVDAYTTLPTICPGLQILNLSDNEVITESKSDEHILRQ